MTREAAQHGAPRPVSATHGAATHGAAARRPAALLLVHLLVALAFFAPPLLRGETFYAFDTLTELLPWRGLATGEVENPLLTDPVTDSYPRQVYLRQHARESGLPLWNDSIAGGAPNLVTSNPLHLALQLLLPVTWAHDLMLFLCLLGSGVFLHLFLRALGLGEPAALLGGVAWALNGWVGVWLEYEPVPLVACALPACLWLGERWLARPGAGTFLAWTAAFAWAAGAAYTMAFQLLEYALFVVGAWLLLRVLVGRAGPGRLASLAACAGALLGGLVLSAFTVLTVWELTRDLHRAPLAFADVYERIGRLSPWYLATTVFPDYFGSPTLPVRFQPRTPSQTYNNYSELCVYVGLPVLVLALSALLRPRRTGVRFFGVVAVVALLMAMGSFLYWPLHRFAPGLSFASPTRTLFVFGFACCVLGAHGLEALGSLGERRWRALLPGGLVAATALGFLVAARVPGASERFLSMAHLRGSEARLTAAEGYFEGHFALGSPVVLAPLVLLAVTLGLALVLSHGRSQRRARLAALALAALTAWDLGSKSLAYNTTSPRTLAYPATPALERLAWTDGVFRVAVRAEDGFGLNTLVPFGFEQAGGYASAQSARYVELLGAERRGGRWVALANLESAVTDLLNVEYVLVGPDTELASGKWELVHDDEVRVYRNRRVFPRAFFVPGARVVASPSASLALVQAARPRDLREAAVLEEEPPAFADPIEPDATGTVEILVHEPDRLVLEVDTDGPGFCVVSQNFHRGWRARVDGTDAPLLRADHVLQAVPVESGTHRVELEFAPASMELGLRASVAGWALWGLAVGLVVARRRARRVA